VPPEITPTLLVGTDQGLHEIALGGGGERPQIGEPRLRGRRISGLAVGRTPGLALIDDREIWRLDPEPAPVASIQRRRATCLLALNGGALVGTAEAHLYRLPDPSPSGVASNDGALEPIETFDRVEGRDSWYTPWGAPADTRSLAIAADGTWYANVHVGGIPASRDEGRTWRPTIEVDADVHQVVAHPERADVVAAACARGLALSTDGGRTWRYETDGLEAVYARAVAFTEGFLLMSTSRGPGGGRAAVYRRPQAGGAFKRCTEGLPGWFRANIDTHCLAALGKRAVFGTDDGRLYLSADEGRSWSLVAEGLASVRCIAFWSEGAGAAR
jgi:hypothetical protein